MTPAQASPAIIRFGVFEADFCVGELRRNGAKVHIQDLPFRALAVLLNRPNEVVTREELRQELWPDDVFVDFDRGISSAIKRVRDALGDSADNPVFVETVERRGYRWIGPIRIAESSREGPAAPPDAPQISRLSPWRKLVFAVPLLALLFAIWMFRTGYRSAQISAKAKEAKSASSSHNAASPEAEDLYLKGRFYWSKRTPESLNQAVDAFTQAIVHDPNYAPAYMGLADCYNLLREYSAMPAREAYSRALAAAKKAVELDDRSSEAHASLAFVTFYGMWDVNAAEREFRRAVELDPNNAKAHHWYATFLQTIGRHEESLVEIERARQLDPNSSSVVADKGRLLWAAGRHDEALQLLKQIEAADPNFASPHRYLKYAYFETGDYSNYLAEITKEAVVTHRDAERTVAEAAAKGFAEHGERGLLESQLQVQQKLYQQGILSAYWLAQTENRLGRTPQALNYLKVCAESHDEAFLLLEEDSTFKNLRDNPTFQQLLSKLGLPVHR
jgi:DNA-binding winged helix-turn-helix (wHTH) protein/Tfp pilus assembly protein PilF